MSYAAERWAQAHTLVVGRDPHALAALKELADAYCEVDGECCIGSLKELALSLGLSKPETASAAVSRLEKLGLVRASNIYSGRVIVGTRFELVGYVEDEWPPKRKGKHVWVEVALSKGLTPMPWWPKGDKPRSTDKHRQTGDPRETGVPRETGGDTPRDGVLVPRETGEGYPAKRGSYKGNMKGNKEYLNGGVAPDSAGVPEVSDAEKSHLETNPSLAQFEGVPFPDFEETTTDDELFAPELLKTTGRKARTHQSKEEKPKATKTTRGTRLMIETLPDEWRAWMAKHFPKYDPDLVFAEFRDYWIGVSGAKGVKLDWFATFRNHVRGIPEWKQKNFIKKDCGQETLPNSNEWTQARRLREGYGWATTY